MNCTTAVASAMSFPTKSIGPKPPSSGTLWGAGDEHAGAGWPLRWFRKEQNLLLQHQICRSMLAAMPGSVELVAEMRAKASQRNTEVRTLLMFDGARAENEC